jgi:hypothetical protein
MSGGYPWSVLGIDPTHDAGEIRRAYARSLRTARPDENPTAFQQLVQARDLALKLASHRRPTEIHGVTPALVEAEAAPEPQPQPREVMVATVTVTFEAEEMEPQPLASPPSPSPPPIPPLSQPPVRVTSRPVGLPLLASPQTVIEAARQMLESEALENWRHVFRQLGELPQRSRPLVERRLLELTAAYAWKKQVRLARRLKTDKPFFDMLAGLNAEFGWRERDRVIYSVLDAAQADAFVSLLDRAVRLPSAEPPVGLLDQKRDEEGFTPNQRRDSYYFFDHNGDLRGLALCRKLLADPRFWLRKDASTALFAPMYPSNIPPRSRRDALGLLGVMFGWITLLMAQSFIWFWVLPIPLVYYVLRDVHFSDPPRAKPWASIHRALWPLMQGVFAIWIAAVVALMVAGVRDWALWLYAPFPLVFAYCAYAAVRLLVGTTKKQCGAHPAWDRKLFFLFPFIAFNRRYYARAISGFLAWFAVFIHQSWTSLDFFIGGVASFGDLVLLMMLLSLHLSAGYNGGLWLVLRFFSTMARADRKSLFKPEQRAAFLLNKGTGKVRTGQQDIKNYRTIWWTVIAIGVLSHILKLLGVK